MRPRPRPARIACIAAGVVAAGALGGCNNQPIVGGPSVTAVPSALSATVDVGTITSYGKVLVTASGHALYLFSADPKTGKSSTCQGSCILVWPPLLVSGAVKSGPGVDPRLLSKFQSSDGGSQVAYGKHPLYTYEEDASAGTAEGEGVETYGGTWWLVSPTGHAVTEPTSGH